MEPKCEVCFDRKRPLNFGDVVLRTAPDGTPIIGVVTNPGQPAYIRWSDGEPWSVLQEHAIVFRDEWDTRSFAR